MMSSAAVALPPWGREGEGASAKVRPIGTPCDPPAVGRPHQTDAATAKNKPSPKTKCTTILKKNIYLLA